MIYALILFPESHSAKISNYARKELHAVKMNKEL